MRHLLKVFAVFSFVLTSNAYGEGRLPDGGIAEAKGIGPVRAWYGMPTKRYDHGVLGDAIEAGSLVVIDSAGRKHELVLPQTFVFEDITPRIADLDGDGRNEVVTIRSKLDAGAAVAIYALEGNELVEKASSQPIGSAHRWLSIAGIGDFLGRGRREIAVVKTPHVGGMLEILDLQKDRLVSLYPPQSGYSTHFIGSRFLSLAAVGDAGRDGFSRLALPNQSRDRVRILDLRKGIDMTSSHALPARVIRPLRVTRTGRLEASLENGKTVTFDLGENRRSRR